VTSALQSSGRFERRMLGHDFHRSGAVEAIAGDAAPAQLSHAMGNTRSASNALFATYVPVKCVLDQRGIRSPKKGSTAMNDEQKQAISLNAPARKV
jgi:hypothetical protein